jgi:hypothetical protein
MADEKKRGRGRPKGTSARPKESNETVIVDPVIAPYKIYIDSNQFNIVDLEKKNEANLTEKSYGYHSTLGGALRAIARMKMVNNKTYSLKDYIEQHEKVVKEMMEKVGV